MATTKVTNSVIRSNTIISDLIANNEIITRHLLDGSVTEDKVSFTVGSGNADAVQANLTSLFQDDALLFQTKIFQNVTVANTFVVGGDPELFVASNTDSAIFMQGNNFFASININMQPNFGIFVSNDPDTALQVATKAYVDNVSATGGANLFPFTNTNIAVGSSNVFWLGGDGLGVSTTSNTISVYLDSIFQPDDEYVYHNSNHSVQLIDATIPAGIQVYTVNWSIVVP